MLDELAILALVLAAIPAVTAAWNLNAFRRLPQAPSAHDPGASGSGPPAVSSAESRPPNLPPLSLLIPARDEQRCIADALDAALANAGVNFEVVVLDDHSTDDTAAIVRDFAARDDRVRLETAPPLPAGWCGKQHACHVLAQRARHDMLVFIDADTRLSPGALSRIAAEMARRPDLDLLSGFPRQETRTWPEKLVLPLISYLILAYLPVRWARRFRFPGFAAGCGQLFIARRHAYEQVGGHAAVRASLHDGVKLPRAFRKAGHTTDIFDASDTAACRMYRGLGELWPGLTKNSIEGLGSPGAIGVWSVLLLGGSVLPILILLAAALTGHAGAMQTAGAAVALAYLTRATAAARFGDTWLGVLGHPLGLTLLMAIQWHGLIRHLRGATPQWKGRNYAQPSG